MRSTIILFALLIARCYGKICSVHDGKGNTLGDIPHRIKLSRKDLTSESILPGELNFENMQPVSVTAGDCDMDTHLDGNRMWFTLKEKFHDNYNCTFKVFFKADPACSAKTVKEYTIEYFTEEEKFQGFVQEEYIFQVIFPVIKGAKVGNAEIEVRNLGFSTTVELVEDFHGLEIVPIESNRDGIARFEVKATKELYLLDDLNLTMIAKNDVLSSKAHLMIHMNENSVLPYPEFEKSFYKVQLNASHLDSITDVYPSGIIKLKEEYKRITFDLHQLNENDLVFSLKNESSQTVGVHLMKTPEKNSVFRDVVLQLTARIKDQFGRESKGYTTLLVEVEGNRCILADTYCFDAKNVEHLTTALIVLSVVVVILLLIIIFLYFKYVCVKKPEPPPPCKKCSAPVPVKTRRPTPRKISEYLYPLDVMPPPMETLTESDIEEGDVNEPEIMVTTQKDEIHPIPSTNSVKTRKRSMTFRESDEEARQYREAPSVAVEAIVHESERKLSNESQRRVSVEEERRRRKSSIKMYRCLT